MTVWLEYLTCFWICYCIDQKKNTDSFLICVLVLTFGWDYIGVIYYSTISVIKFWTSEHTTMFLKQKRYIIFVYFLLKPCVQYVFEMEDIGHFGFIEFYTDKQSVEPKKTFVLVFSEQLELRQKSSSIWHFW